MTGIAACHIDGRSIGRKNFAELPKRLTSLQFFYVLEQFVLILTSMLLVEKIVAYGVTLILPTSIFSKAL